MNVVLTCCLIQATGRNTVADQDSMWLCAMFGLEAKTTGQQTPTLLGAGVLVRRSIPGGIRHKLTKHFLIKTHNVAAPRWHSIESIAMDDFRQTSIREGRFPIP